MDSDDTKTCPYCAETIKAAAVVCRYCGRDLTQAQAKQPAPKAKKPGGCIGPLFVSFIVIFLALIWMLVSSRPSSPVRYTSASQPAVSTVTLTCADCVAEGMPANIWANQNMDRVVCRLAWGQQVDRIQSSGNMTRIRSGTCDGWIRSSLVK